MGTYNHVSLYCMKEEVKLPSGTKRTEVKGICEKGQGDKNLVERVAWGKYA